MVVLRFVDKVGEDGFDGLFDGGAVVGNIFVKLLLRELRSGQAVGHVVDHGENGVRNFVFLGQGSLRGGGHANDIAKLFQKAHLGLSFKARAGRLHVRGGALLEGLNIGSPDGVQNVSPQGVINAGDDMAPGVVEEGDGRAEEVKVVIRDNDGADGDVGG